MESILLNPDTGPPSWWTAARHGLWGKFLVVAIIEEKFHAAG
jgi:hypothetical protein